MFNYPAVWQIDEVVDSEVLLREFNEAMSDQLKVIYPKNNDWTGISVLSGGGLNHLAKLPMLSSFLEQFGQKNVLGVTYFNLAPHSFLHRHRDMNGNLLFGVIRLHVPLQTNPDAIIEVQKRPIHMPINTIWALDTSGLHALQNRGDKNRIHLVVDIKYSKSTSKYFPDFSLAILLHVIFFIFIVVANIVRDIFVKPDSLIARLKTLYMRIFSK